MIRHLTLHDYRRQPWANGRGETVELARADGPEGLLWRLSVATVAEDGPFSVLPGIDRVLTVISGPGFRLRGDGLVFQARPFRPVAFPGDAAIRAEGVAAPSEDFNLMLARGALTAQVTLPDRAVPPPAEGTFHALFAPEGGRAAGRRLGPRDLLLADEGLDGLEGRLLAALLPGAP